MPIRQGESAVYRFRAGAASRILRLTDLGHRTRQQLEAELDFVAFVPTHGVSAAQPVPSTAGAVVEDVTRLGGGPAAHAVVFEEMPGRHFAYRSPDVDRPLFERWGRTLGALHAASRAYRPPPRRRHAWRDDPAMRADAASLPPDETAARREHERVYGWLATRRESPETVGLIHGDLERTNFLLDGDRLHVLDFDDACYHWYLADAAHALWAFRGAAPDERRRFLEWFAAGYGEPLDREAFSWFVRLRSLGLFTHALPGADPAWLARMRAGFEAEFEW